MTISCDQYQRLLYLVTKSCDHIWWPYFVTDIWGYQIWALTDLQTVTELLTNLQTGWPYTVDISGGHIWSFPMVTTSYDYILWPIPGLTKYGHYLWWPYMVAYLVTISVVTKYGHYIWWPYVMTICDEHVWCPMSGLTKYGHYIWWPYLVTIFGNYIFWPYLVTNI